MVAGQVEPSPACPFTHTMSLSPTTAVAKLFFLRCVGKTHPDIALPNGEAVIIGRDVATTKIKDARLSRQHLRMTANYAKAKVRIDHLGNNASEVNGRTLSKGESVLASPGDAVNLLVGKYQYMVMGQKEDKITSNKAAAAVEVKRPNNNKMWSAGLLASMDDPDLFVSRDDTVVVIKDKYPKAKFHFLVLPRKERINTLKDVSRSHLPLLEHMQEVGLKLAAEHPEGKEFGLGYHAVPSMSLIHLHVVSQDFVSPCMKTKKHWNSFTTEYFVHSEELIRQVRRDGRFNAMSAEAAKELLDRKLKCHRCKFEPRNMPELKEHLLQHAK